MDTRQANIIKIGAVFTAAPRWIGALLAAEGFDLPESWLAWWIVVSALLSAAMALVEGWSFAFIFNAWRNQTDKRANRLLWLALLSALIFVFVLSPFIAAQVRQATLNEVLGTGWPLWLWSGSVAASTIVIVAGVGYAQKAAKPRVAQAKAEKDAPADWQIENACWCGWMPKRPTHIEQQKSAHFKRHSNEVMQYSNVGEALLALKQHYPSAFKNGNEPVTTEDVAQWRERRK